MGDVWGGVHRQLGTPVAVKLLTSERARETRYRASFRNEARLVAGLDHPNIVHVFDFGEVNDEAARLSGGKVVPGAPWLAMERVDGGTLQEVARQLDWEALRSVLLGLLDALAHAHARGVVHRDLKPGNVLVDPTSHSGEPVSVKLTDFGVAHALDTRPDDEEDLSLFSGTPAYMAPEQFIGRWRDYGPWTDLYALGCLAWALATGSYLYGRKSVEDRAVAHLKEPLPAFRSRILLPDGFEAWLARLLEKHPRRRFQRAADAAFALRSLGEPGGPHRTIRFTLPPQPDSWRPIHAETSAELVGAGLGLYGLRPVPLVDREPERDVLWEALARSRATRRGEVVVLHGPSGCGKSHLAEWIAERAHEVGAAHVLEAHHSEVPGPGHGLGAMVARFAACQGLDRAGVSRRLERVLRRLGLHDDGDREVLTEWIAPASDADTAAGVRPLRFASATERYVVLHRVLGALCAERPAILWLDDVQWGLDALQFVHWLLEEDAKLPVLLVLTARDREMAGGIAEQAVFTEILAHPRAQERPIGPLAPSDRPELVRRLLGLQPDLAKRVEEVTAGNPMFAVQLVGDWVDRGLLVPDRRGFRLRPGVEVPLPRDVAAVWADRIARLLERRGDKEGLALEIAAVLGRHVDPREWRGVCRTAGANPSTALVETLLDQRLATCDEAGPENGWSFVHVTLLEALHRRSLERGRLRTLHRLAANRLQEAGTGPDLAERLGRHLVAAGDAHAALDPLLTAIREKTLAGEYAAAEALVVLREKALQDGGVRRDNPLWGEGWLWRFRIETRRGNYQAAERWLEHTEAAAVRHGWRTQRLHAQVARGRLARLRSEYRTAVDLLRAAEPEAERLSDPDLRADLRWDLAEALSETGELISAELYARKALKDYIVLQDIAGCAQCWQTMGEIKKLQGAHDQATQLLKNALELHEESGARWGMASACNSLGDVARYEGRHDEAENWYVRAGALFRAIGSGSAAYPEYNRALSLLERGRPAEARPVLEDCLAAFNRQGRMAAQADAHLALCACAAGVADWEAWDAQFAQARQLLHRTGASDEDTARLAELLATTTETAGSAERARLAWETALAQWDGLDRFEEANAVRARL